MLIKRKICYVLILVLCMLQVSGCKSKSKDSDNAGVAVLTINGQAVYLDEVLYRVWEYEEEHSYYSEDYQAEYGTDYWESELTDGVTVSENLKEELYEDILRDYLLYEKATEEGVTLTEEEKELFREQATIELSEMSDDVRDAISATENLLIRMKEHNQVVSSYFSSLLDTYQVDEETIQESIDKVNYEQLDIQTIGFSKYVYDAMGNETEKSDEEKAEGLERLNAIVEEAKSTEDLNDFLAEDETLLETEELSIIPGESACDLEIEEAAMNMEPGDTSDVIETENGYYIVRLLDNTSEDAYDETVENAILNEKYKQFDAYFETLKESAKVETTEKWDAIKIGGTIIKNE